MSSFIIVKENPYFTVTDEKGNFRIDNVPAGKYTIEVWQEKVGKRKSEVTVKPKEDAVVDFDLAKK
jgi:hypothetical protein